MLELIVYSYVIFGNPQGLWSPNSSVWFLPSDRPGDEQLYEPLLETLENDEQDKRVL
jgi:hypothetical protein